MSLLKGCLNNPNRLAYKYRNDEIISHLLLIEDGKIDEAYKLYEDMKPKYPLTRDVWIKCCIHIYTTYCFMDIKGTALRLIGRTLGWPHERIDRYKLLFVLLSRINLFIK